MKKFIYMFLVALFAALPMTMLTSCSDDDENPAGSDVLVGTWVGTYEGYNDDSEEVVTMTFTNDGRMIANEVENGRTDWTFDGSYTIQTREYSDGVHYMISIIGIHSDYPEENPYDDDVDYREFYIEGNDLYISFDGSDFVLRRQ